MALDRHGGEVLRRRTASRRVGDGHLGIYVHEGGVRGVGVGVPEAVHIPARAEDRQRPCLVGVGELLGADREGDVSLARCDRGASQMERCGSRGACVLDVENRRAKQSGLLQRHLSANGVLAVERTLAAVGKVHRLDVGRRGIRVGKDAANSVDGQFADGPVDAFPNGVTNAPMMNTSPISQFSLPGTEKGDRNDTASVRRPVPLWRPGRWGSEVLRVPSTGRWASGPEVPGSPEPEPGDQPSPSPVSSLAPVSPEPPERAMLASISSSACRSAGLISTPSSR